MRVFVGGNVDSHCGPCKGIFAHTVLTLKADGEGMAPHKVQCRTCRGLHSFRLKPVSKGKGGSKAATVEATPFVARDYRREKWMDACLNGQAPQTYKVGATYQIGALIGHPNLGLGSVVSRSADRIWILFESGEKQLIVSKGAPAPIVLPPLP